jgi:hypothetical protein
MLEPIGGGAVPWRTLFLLTRPGIRVGAKLGVSSVQRVEKNFAPKRIDGTGQCFGERDGAPRSYPTTSDGPPLNTIASSSSASSTSSSVG